MKHGIYYAYWEKQWGADYLKYVKKVKDLILKEEKHNEQVKKIFRA